MSIGRRSRSVGPTRVAIPPVAGLAGALLLSGAVAAHGPVPEEPPTHASLVADAAAELAAEAVR